MNLYLASGAVAMVAGFVGYRLRPPRIVEGANELSAAGEGIGLYIYVLLPAGVVLALGAVGALVLACIDVLHNRAVAQGAAQDSQATRSHRDPAESPSDDRRSPDPPTTRAGTTSS
jgi:hypothetical protein